MTQSICSGDVFACRSEIRGKLGWGSSGNGDRRKLSPGPPWSDVRFSDNSLSSDACAVEIRPFPRANQVCSGFYLDLDLSACYGDTASIPPPADAKTGTDISDIHCTNFHLQFAGVVVFDIKISVASQQLDPGRLGVRNSDTAIGVQTDVDVRCCGYCQPLSRYGLVNPG